MAHKIAAELKVELGKVELADFANGEISCQLNQSVRGNNVYVIQSHSGNVNHSVMEQALMIDTAKRSAAHSVTAVCPFLSYARQDRKAKGREPIAARLVIDILAAAGADQIMSVDLHSGQIQGFFNGPFDHLIAGKVLRDYLKQTIKGDMVIVSPDAGRVKSAERYSSILGCDMAIVHKQRSTSQLNKAEARHLIGEVKGKDCVIVDDMIDTAGTICAAADILSQNGAGNIYGLATHGIFSEPALDRIEKSAFNKIIVTDTLPSADSQRVSKIEVVSIAPLIASAIAEAFKRGSVSALFDGQNQI